MVKMSFLCVVLLMLLSLGSASNLHSHSQIPICDLYLQQKIMNPLGFYTAVTATNDLAVTLTKANSARDVIDRMGYYTPEMNRQILGMFQAYYYMKEQFNSASVDVQNECASSWTL